MAQQKIWGIGLRQAPNPRKKDGKWLIQSAIAALSCIILMMTATAFAGINSWSVVGVMIAAALLLGLSYAVLLKTEHESWFYLGILTFALVMSLVCRKQLLEGFRIFWNQAGSAMVRGTGWVIPQWQLQLKSGQETLCLCMFLCFCVCLVSFVCMLLTAYAPVVLAVLQGGFLMLGMTMFQVELNFIWTLPMLGTAVLLLMYSGWQGRSGTAPILMNWLACIVVLCIVLSGLSAGNAQSWLEQTRDQIHASLHEKKYETKYTTLPEGDFTDFKVKNQKAQPALAVTMEIPQMLYLRGYTGAEFTGETWEALDQSALEKNKELLYWINLNAFDQNAQFDSAALLAQSPQSNVSVQNIGACSYYRYVPFSIGAGDWVQPENLNTDGVYAEGERNYFYSISPGNSEEISRVLTYLQSSQDAAVQRFRKAESGYRQFIYNYYLQVPDQVLELLQEQWDEIASIYGGADNMTQEQAQGCALLFLSECFPEEGIPEEMELPLDDLRGTTYQYATVAVMALRYFGIPARYAEGYVISRDLASKHQSGETITVDSTCAMAWVEVYQDGIGWIPMDLTPGMGEMLEKMENSLNQGKGNSKKDTKEKKEEEQKQEEEQEPVGGTMVRILKAVITGTLVTIGFILLLILILLARRKVLLSRKYQKFQSADPSEGVAWIYADTEILLQKLGFNRGNGSMRNLRAPLAEKYGEEFAKLFDQVTDLNDFALFSTAPLTREQRKIAESFRNSTLEKLNEEAQWYRTLWLRWALCLY